MNLSLLASLGLYTSILGASFNFTSGFRVDGNIPYSCSIVTPSSFDLVIDGAVSRKISSSGVLAYAQNGKSDFSISSVTVSAPSQAQVVGKITLGNSSVTGKERNLVMENSTDSLGSVTTRINGNFSVSNFPMEISIEETLLPNLQAGTYEISSTISCSESL